MLISTTQRECSRGPQRAASVLLRLPSIFKFPPNVFKVQGQPQVCLNRLFFSSAGWAAFGAVKTVDGRQQRGVGGTVRNRRAESHTVTSPTLRVYSSLAPSLSDALKDQWQHKERSNKTV